MSDLGGATRQQHAGDAYGTAVHVGGHAGGGPAMDSEDARQAAVRDAAERHASKHGRLIRSARDGRILSAMMLPFFLVRPPKGYGVLTTTGRKSGKPRHKCVRVSRRGDRAYLTMLRPPALAVRRPSAVAAWVLNIRADPHVRLRVCGGTFTGVAQELSDPAERARAREALCETVNLFDYGECDVHLRGLPTRAKIKELHGYWFDTGIPLAIDLEDPSAQAR
jgi:deazaflavin-dependent oxidoreductase (nitroreductase family)